MNLGPSLRHVPLTENSRSPWFCLNSISRVSGPRFPISTVNPSAGTAASSLILCARHVAVTRPAGPLHDPCTATGPGPSVVVSLGVGRDVGREVGRDVGRELGRGVGRGVACGVVPGVGWGGVGVMVVPGSFRAAWLVPWAPAREIADHTLMAANATTMVQTTAHTMMGSPRLIGPSCRTCRGFRWRRVVPMARVLIIEDDLAIRSALKRVLTERGDVVAVAGTGMAGMTILMREQPDIVLLDLGLPDLDGFGVLGMLRAVSEVPVIVITAQDDDRSTIRALDAGADDYVTKPFGADQVAARMRAVLRRSRREPDEEDPALVIGELVIDPRSREVTLAGRPGGPLPQGVRRPARARQPGRCGGHQARVADGGVAAARTAVPIGRSTST